MARRNEDTISGDTLQAPQQTVVDNISATKFAQAPREGNVFDNNGNAFLPITKAENMILILANDKRKGTVIMNMEEDVIDPETGNPRRMRLLRGAKSIWFDEQPPSVYPEKFVNQNLLTLKFNRGVCIIPFREVTMVKAAQVSFRNIATKKKYPDQAHPKDIYYYEWNPKEINEKSIREENDVIQAMQLAMTTPIEEIVPHANYLNIPFADEMGVPLDEQALKTAYIKYAKNNADKFLKSVHSPTVKIAHMVKKALDSGKIDLGRQPGAAYWTDGGFISTLPQGRDAVAYLIEFAMTHGDANTMFANQLRELTS